MPRHSCSLTSLLFPASDCEQAALYGPWLSSHLLGIATSAFLFCAFFFSRVSTEQSDDRDSVFSREGQNFLPPVIMVSLSIAKVGMAGLHPTMKDGAKPSLGFCTVTVCYLLCLLVRTWLGVVTVLVFWLLLFLG